MANFRQRLPKILKKVGKVWRDFYCSAPHLKCAIRKYPVVEMGHKRILVGRKNSQRLLTRALRSSLTRISLSIGLPGCPARDSWE
jgi:hypothetical protein